jgi:hypothetical protein
MKKQKTKKTKRSPIDCENSVSQVTRSKQKISSKQALFLWKFSPQLSESPTSSSTQARKRQKGYNWTRRGHESAAWRRSRTTIATQKNKSVDAQNLKEEGSRGRFFFFPAHLPRTTPSTFLSCWIGIGSPDLSFYNPLPRSRGQGFRQVSEAVLGLSVSRGGSFPVKLKPLNNYSVGA